MLDDSPVRAAQAILMAAKQGVVDAQALLGQILLDGRGIERDQALALRWFEIAAQGGHLMARNMVGRCLSMAGVAPWMKQRRRALIAWRQRQGWTGRVQLRQLAGHRPRRRARSVASAALLSPGGRAGPRQVDEPGGALSGRLASGVPGTWMPLPTGIDAQPRAGIFAGSSAMRRCWPIEAKSKKRWRGCTRRWQAATSNSCARRTRHWRRRMTRRFAQWRWPTSNAPRHFPEPKKTHDTSWVFCVRRSYT